MNNRLPWFIGRRSWAKHRNRRRNPFNSGRWRSIRGVPAAYRFDGSVNRKDCPNPHFIAGEKSLENLTNNRMLQVLPTVRLNGRAYFIDPRLRQFRETMNPQKRIDFDSATRERLSREAGVIKCLSCGMSVIVVVPIQEEDSPCMRCGNVIDAKYRTFGHSF